LRQDELNYTEYSAKRVLNFRLLLYESFPPFRETFCLFYLQSLWVGGNVLCNMHVMHLPGFKIRQYSKANCAACYEFCEIGIGNIILVTPLEMSSMDCQHLECPSQTFITPYTLLVHGLIWKGRNNIRTISVMDFGRCVENMSW